jgi:hypothetical protein
MQRGYRNWRGYVLSNVGDKSGDAGEGGGGGNKGIRPAGTGGRAGAGADESAAQHEHWALQHHAPNQSVVPPEKPAAVQAVPTWRCVDRSKKLETDPGEGQRSGGGREQHEARHNAGHKGGSTAQTGQKRRHNLKPYQMSAKSRKEEG